MRDADWESAEPSGGCKTRDRRASGRIESGFYAFGEYDIVLVIQFADNVSAAAYSVDASGGGAGKAIKTTRVMTNGDNEKPRAPSVITPLSLFNPQERLNQPSANPPRTYQPGSKVG